MKRTWIPPIAFVAGATIMAGLYFGLLSGLQGWTFAAGQFTRDWPYLISIWLAFGVQAALYSILRFRLFVPGARTGYAGLMMGTSGGTSATAMVACCLHHVTDVLPILGISAAATFLTRYQRPFMLTGLAMNLLGIAIMLAIIYRERRKLTTPVSSQLVPEIQ